VSKVRVVQVRSTIGQTKAHEGTLRSLGLGRIGRSAEHTLSPELEGKLRHVRHLVQVEPKER
jgi:large subunit ribosomal protein L30